MKAIYQTENIAQMEDVARELLREAGTKRIFALYGDLGAGKTTLVQAFCRVLGVREKVSSPTFSLVNEYTYADSETGQERLVYHMDLYRLKTIEEALDIGMEEYFDAPYFCFVEWPQVAEPLLPEDCLRIKLEIIGNSGRKILLL